MYYTINVDKIRKEDAIIKTLAGRSKRFYTHVVFKRLEL